MLGCGQPCATHLALWCPRACSRAPRADTWGPLAPTTAWAGLWGLGGQGGGRAGSRKLGRGSLLELVETGQLEQRQRER